MIKGNNPGHVKNSQTLQARVGCRDTRTQYPTIFLSATRWQSSLSCWHWESPGVSRTKGRMGKQSFKLIQCFEEPAVIFAMMRAPAMRWPVFWYSLPIFLRQSRIEKFVLRLLQPLQWVSEWTELVRRKLCCRLYKNWFSDWIERDEEMSEWTVRSPLGQTHLSCFINGTANDWVNGCVESCTAICLYRHLLKLF